MMKTAMIIDEERSLDDFWSVGNDGDEFGTDGKRKKNRYPREDEEHSSERGPSPAPDTIKVYLKEVRKTVLLTFEQEQALAKRVAEGDTEARAAMIEAN